MSYRIAALRAVALGALLAVLPARTAGAQERTLFRWSGTVDREVQLVLRGRDLATRHLGDDGSARDGSRSRVLGALPREEGVLVVELADGRGSADVVQQPSRSNDWTAIVRVRDPRAGADRYRLSGSWRSAGNGTYAGDDRWERDGRDDRWERDGRDERDRRRGRDDRDGRWERGDDRDDRRGGWERGGGGSLRWRGLVDDAVLVRVSGRRVDDTVLRGEPLRDVQVDVRGRGLAGRGEEIRLTRVSGRGQVTILEQPSARNGYTALLRISDPRSGAGWYDFDASW